MSLKTKLTSLITTFVLLCSLLTVGVFAVKNTTFNVGGNIEFNVQGIEASITRDSYAGFVTTNDKTIGDAEGNVLSSFTLDNTMSADQVSSKLAPWSGLKLAFNEATTATIKLTIKNTAQAGADNYLDITAIADATTKNNAKVSVVNDAGGITALLQPQQSASFTITFSVIDDEYSASLEGFSVNFDMQKKVLAEFPALSADMTYQTLKFRTISGESGLSVEDIGTEQSYDGEDFYYQSTGNIVIPAYVNYNGTVYTVTKIDVCAFGSDYFEMGCGIDSIEIPNTIIDIGAYAFCGTSLGNITIPDGVTSIGDWAFAYCYSLTSITIPDGVTSIGYNVFAYCTSLTSVTIPDTVIRIGDYAFDGCSSLTSIEIPSSVTTIGGGAFWGTRLTSITIPDKVTIIGSESFADCASLTTVTIPDSVTSIGDGAFSGCSSLTSIIIPDSVTIIESQAFTDCTSLTTVTIPDSVTSIGFGAFRNCSSLTSIIIPDSVTIIGSEAFADCASLTTVTIPDSVTSIGEDAFSGCSSLSKITILSFHSSNNAGFISFIAAHKNATLNVIIKNSETFIGYCAFYGCTGLTSIIIPSSIVKIEPDAFKGCSSLKIYYTGTEEEWNSIEGLEYAEIPSEVTINYNYVG